MANHGYNHGSLVSHATDATDLIRPARPMQLEDFQWPWLEMSLDLHFDPAEFTMKTHGRTTEEIVNPVLTIVNPLLTIVNHSLIMG